MAYHKKGMMGKKKPSKKKTTSKRTKKKNPPGGYKPHPDATLRAAFEIQTTHKRKK